MELTATTAKYALVLMSIGGAAAGLNLGVMELTDSPSTQTTEEVLLSSGSEPVVRDPLQVVVDVPVVVPDSIAATEFAEPALDVVATSSTLGPAAKAHVAVPSAASTATPLATRAPSPSTSTVAATEYKYYNFPGVASEIVVAQHGDGSLEFWSVTPESGWSYRVEKDTSRIVKVEFSREPNGEGEAEWALEYKDGDLRVEKEISFGNDEDEYDDQDDYDEDDEDDEDEHEEEDDD